MDILAVYQACKFAKEWCVAGKGPLVVEMVTYRYAGHSVSDPGTTYRTREEIQDMRNTKDSITGLLKRIVDWKVADDVTMKVHMLSSLVH